MEWNKQKYDGKLNGQTYFNAIAFKINRIQMTIGTGAG